MSQHLEGTVALVTGASSGIGEATARRLAAEGAAVALAARRVDRLEKLASEITAAGGRALVIETDVTDQEQAAGAVQQAVAELGSLGLVVNNAGIMLNGPSLDLPVEDWQRMVDLNVLGLVYVTHAALPHLLAAADVDPRGVADLVNISSVAGRTARPGSAVYNLTKHGVGAFSDSLRQEFAARHLRVSLVEPGAVATELATHLSPASQRLLEERFADVEMLHADDIADAIAYVVTRPRHVAINELLVRPTQQEG